MTNRMIREAWDTVNPTQRQKERMRAALEAHLEASGKSAKRTEKNHRLPQEEQVHFDFTLPEDPYAVKPQERLVKAEKKERRYYSSKQAKTNWPVQIAAIAAVLMVTVAGGLFLGWMSGQNRETPSYAAPGFTETTSATKPAEPEATTEYQTILDKYKTAIAERWDADRCRIEKISPLVMDVESVDDLGFTFLDLDNDGNDEFLITDGDVIYCAYTCNYAGATIWFRSSQECKYYLSDDNLIPCVTIEREQITSFICHKMDASPDYVSFLVYDPVKDRDKPWVESAVEDDGTFRRFTDAEAKAIMDQYPHRAIPFTPLSGRTAENKTTKDEAPVDEALLKLYAQSIPEAMKNYTKSEEKTFCFYDSDGDGKDELLLGGGESVYRILQPMTGSEDFIDIAMPTGEQSYAYLCEGNVFELEGYGQGNWYHHYIKIGDADGSMDIEEVDDIFHNEENGSWYLGGPGINTPIPDEDAEAIQKSHPRLKLDWKSLSQFPVPVTMDTLEGTALFEKVFMSIATGDSGNTQEALTNLLNANGFQWSNVDGMIDCADPDAPDSYLKGYLNYQNGALEVFSLNYVRKDGEQYRKAEIEFRNGKDFFIGTDPFIYVGAQVEAAGELREFVFGENDSLMIKALIMEFTEAYFCKDDRYMREHVTSDFGELELYSGEYAPSRKDIGHIQGLPLDGEWDGMPVALYVECMIPPETDSYSRLTFDVDKEDGVWKVHYCGLEK